MNSEIDYPTMEAPTAPAPTQAAGAHGSLKELLTDVLQRLQTTKEGGDAAPADAYKVLLDTLKSYHYWPALQVKNYFRERGMVLLHNTYKRDDVFTFQALYDECRSVVLDLTLPEGSNIVVSLANSVPDRLEDQQYKRMVQDTDVCEESFEGTVVSVYFHRDKWHFSTSTCPDVNNSRFSHPSKTHGDMLDEALAHADLTRDKLAAQLDVQKAYAFLLVHPENGHVMRNTEHVAAEARLYHISTRDRDTLCAEDVGATRPLEGHGIHYAQRFATPTDALDWLAAHPDVYGIIVRRANGSLIKVSSAKILELEQIDYGNSNPWYNFLWIYMQSKPNFHVNDYIARFCPDIQLPLDHAGKPLAPVYVIHTVVCTMRDVLLQLYRATTTYFTQYKRFKMNKEADATLAPILRFHLAQLRRIQVTTHTDEMVNAKTVYHYLCHHTTMKNMRMLIKFFARSPQPMINVRAAECFAVLDACLSD